MALRRNGNGGREIDPRKRAWSAYRFRGGRLSFTRWLAAGQPYSDLDDGGGGDQRDPRKTEWRAYRARGGQLNFLQWLEFGQPYDDPVDDHPTITISDPSRFTDPPDIPIPSQPVTQVGGAREFADVGAGTGVIGGVRPDLGVSRGALISQVVAEKDPRILISRYDGGWVDAINAKNLGNNQFQEFVNFSDRYIKTAVRSQRSVALLDVIDTSYLVPGQGYYAYHAEWDDAGTPVQTPTIYHVLAKIVSTAGAWEINIQRINATLNSGWSTEFIDETAAKGGWERGTSNRFVEGSTDVTFTASTRRISGVANLANYNVGEILRVFNTTDNNGYFTVAVKEPAGNTVQVKEALTNENSVSAYIYPLPIVSMFALGGALRISNGNFYDSHSSQWYGHIKRYFWGQGVTYESDAGRFKQPAMKEAYNNWKLQNQELVKPIMVAGSRTGKATNAANQVAIHIAGTHVSGWPEKAVDTTWNAQDRITCTFVYDFTQESELGRTANGEIGLEMGTIITAADARAFMVEVYTGAANASWNRRITGIKLYYKFHGTDVDWYEVEHLEINNCWKGSEKIFNAKNTGYWIPIMSSVIDTGTTDGSGNTGTGFLDTPHGILVNQIIYIDNTSTIEPASLMTYAKTITDVNNIVLPVAPVDSLGASPANWRAADWCSGAPSTVAVATFYIPFTGEKAFTYFTNTGRSTKLKVPAFRWKAADTDGEKVLYGNIDTIDENEQTYREKTRVIETPAGMPDTALLNKSKDVGSYLGDEIKAIKYYAGNWWVLLDKHIVVLQPGTLRVLNQYFGMGCKWQHSFVDTAYGLCVADEAGIYQLPTGKRLTDNIDKVYQDSYSGVDVFADNPPNLSFFGCTLSYSMRNQAIYFMPDPAQRTNDAGKLFVYRFQTGAWSKETITSQTGLLFTNPVSFGRLPSPATALRAAGNEPEYINVLGSPTSTNLGSIQLNDRTDDQGSQIEGNIKTREFDNGLPFVVKRHRHGYWELKTPNTASNNFTKVEVYLDGGTVAYKTIDIADNTSMRRVLLELNVECKTIVLNLRSDDPDLEVGEFSIPPEETTFLSQR